MRTIFLLALLCPALSMCQPLSIHGNVVNETAEPVAGATATLKRTGAAVITNNRGEFSFAGTRITDSVTVSAAGYESTTVPTNERGFITIILHRSTGLLNEVMVIAYGTTTRKLATGSTGQLTAAQIAAQPVFDPLSALQGRITGLTVSPSSGVPGASVKLQIRGRASIANGSDPLFVIDGVPLAANNSPVNQYPSAAGGFPDITTGLSPLAAINPADIESIDVLKDADATAIYGSRGANGVILITTKKGRIGKTTANASIYTGVSEVARTATLLSTPDYLRLRREAFANDGVTPTTANAPDLAAWDTTRFTDFRKQLLGGHAPTTDAQVSVAGGSGATRFTTGGGYHREGVVVPGHLSAVRGSTHFALQHSSADARFTLAATASYSSLRSNIIVSDLTSYTLLPPNYPAFSTPDGGLNWQEGGVPISNPFAYLLQTYKAVTDNLLGNLTAACRIGRSLTAKVSGGYNTTLVAEQTVLPKASINPFNAAVPLGSSQAGFNSFKSWIAEPQLLFADSLGEGRIDVLVGATFQHTENTAMSVSATGYTNDALLLSFSGAAATATTNGYSLYRYSALFGRIGYNWDDRYLLTLSGRRDGSSRFGPGRQFAGFGAVGGAWIFSNEKWCRKLSWLSFGKLRGSLGTTGNDQIGNYQYLDTWVGSTRPYGGSPSLYPNRLYNPDYGWEKNTKWDGAVELGFLQERIFLSVDYFQNRSGNQLVRYTLPAITGFTSVIKNLPATVQNEGWEATLHARISSKQNFSWSTVLTATAYRNKLISFPGLETSSYASTYAVGQSLSVHTGYHLLGVDPATGVYTFEDRNKDGVLDAKDYVRYGNTDPAFYGGLENNFTLKGWTLTVFLEGKKQQGLSWAAGALVPGTMFNLPQEIGQRWQRPGDVATFQKVTATAGTPAYNAAATYALSDGIYTDASYVRLKTVALSYSLPVALLRKWRGQKATIFLQGQNLALLTNYKAADPEIQSLTVLPLLRTMTIGASLTF